MKSNTTDMVTELCAEGGTAFSLQLQAKLHEEQTEYQHIAVYQSSHFGNVLAIDGFFQLTSRDNFLYHEMLVHPAMFTHQQPQQVAVIGGGDCGTLREVLKHETVKRVTQIEIDERVTRIAEQFFPELCAANSDPRAQLIFGDGIQWVADAPPQSLDVIIVDSTDPIGPAKGLFGQAFYESCLQALRPGGLLVQQSESPMFHKESIILPMHQAMRTSGFQRSKTLYFPQPCYPSGWWTATMAASELNLLTAREHDIEKRGFKTTHYNWSVHQAALADPQFMYEALLQMDYLQ